MATPTDKQFLEETNKRLGKKYTTVQNYLTDNGRLKETGESYKRRKAAVENFRGTATRKEFVSSQKWVDYITEKYGWLVSVYNSVPEVADIIRNAYINDEPPADVTTKINSSQWGLGLQVGEADYLKGTATQDRSYLDKLEGQKTIIRAQAQQSGYQLPEDKLNLLAAGSLKGGWDQPTLTNKIGESVVASAQTPGGVMAGAPSATPATSLQQGTSAATLKSQARSYGLNLTDDTIEGYVQSILKGTLSADQVTSQFRTQAKSLYPSLAKQLDSGTLDDATSSYRSIASKTLGVDSSAIDFSDSGKYGKLLTYQDPKSGESRLMNSTEWTTYLRGLPEWQKTSESKDQYSGLINSITQLFGKVG